MHQLLFYIIFVSFVSCEWFDITIHHLVRPVSNISNICIYSLSNISLLEPAQLEVLFLNNRQFGTYVKILVNIFQFFALAKHNAESELYHYYCRDLQQTHICIFVYFREEIHHVILLLYNANRIDKGDPLESLIFLHDPWSLLISCDFPWTFSEISVFVPTFIDAISPVFLCEKDKSENFKDYFGIFFELVLMKERRRPPDCPQDVPRMFCVQGRTSFVRQW